MAGIITSMPGSEAAKAVKILDGNKKDINIKGISGRFCKVRDAAVGQWRGDGGVLRANFDAPIRSANIPRMTRVIRAKKDALEESQNATITL